MSVTLLISLYLGLTFLVGLIASRWIRTTEDYLLAGRRLPFFIATATLFATWFGSETILGSSSEFAAGGLIAVIRDPFGAALCLVLVGLIYARPLYRMKLLTLGDFYRERYGPFTERMAAICMVLTFLTWIAAQFVAFGIIMNVLVGVPIITGFILAGVVVTAYTFIGGMWSVSITDFMQMGFIMIGLAAASLEVFGLVSPATLLHEAPEGFFRFFPEPGLIHHTDYVAAWITIGLGSIANQDIFQRVMASRSERVAVRSAYTAAAMYLTVALIPLMLALAGRHLLTGVLADDADPQLIIPNLILHNTSPLVQVLFFGALLSAILSTASSALLAPAAILSENLLKPLRKSMSDKQLLRLSRLSVLFISLVSTVIALHSGNIYHLVGEAASLGLVSLFVPLTAGLFWKRSNAAAAIASMLAGLIAWLGASMATSAVDPVLWGVAAASLAMLAGGYLFETKT